MRSATFAVLWDAKAAGSTVQGRAALQQARRRTMERGHPHVRISDRALRDILDEGNLVIVAGSPDALEDAELTITDEAFHARAARREAHRS